MSLHEFAYELTPENRCLEIKRLRSELELKNYLKAKIEAAFNGKQEAIIWLQERLRINSALSFISDLPHCVVFLNNLEARLIGLQLCSDSGFSVEVASRLMNIPERAKILLAKARKKKNKT